MKKITAVLAGLSAMAFATAAQAQTVQINYTGTPTAVPGSNDFQTQLATAGVTQYVTTNLASLVLSGPATLRFDYLGSESLYFDTFSLGAMSYTEMSTGVDNRFGSPVRIGEQTYLTGGNLANLLFSTFNPGGAPAGLGTEGFGVFLPADAVSGQNYSTFYLGYDDQLNHADDNHDDFIVRVTVGPQVPEPSTWAMMLVGFGAVGYGMRRRSAKRSLQAA